MNLYDVTLSSQVTGTFRVIADNHSDAKEKASRMYSNGIDHKVNGIEILQIIPIQSEVSTDARH